MNTTLDQSIALIKELRNSRGVAENWPAFKELIEGDIQHVTQTFSIRWMVSVCDTYADYGDDVERRNAFLISMFVNMLRLAETTYFVSGPFRDSSLSSAALNPIELYEGVCTFAVDRQDVFLNVSKRMDRLLANDPIFFPIWITILKRIHDCENVISRFKRSSQKPERYFPIESRTIEYNYRVV